MYIKDYGSYLPPKAIGLTIKARVFFHHLPAVMNTVVLTELRNYGYHLE